MRLFFLFLSSTTIIVSAFDPCLLADSSPRLLLSVGREEGTAMPVEWASSGARLGLSFSVCFQKSAATDQQEKLLGPDKTRVIIPLSQPSFVGLSGEESIRVTAGGWCAKPIENNVGQQVALRFFLDFPDGAARNDVVLPAGRIFFSTYCWLNDSKLIEAQEASAWTQTELADVQQKLKTQQQENKGPLQKATGIRTAILQTERKQLLERKLANQRRSLPGNDDVVPGPNDILLKKQGMLYVKRFGGFLGRREEYHIVGTFKFSGNSTQNCN